MYYSKLVASALMLAALIAAAWYSVRLARADYYFHHRTAEQVERALEIDPANSEYLAFRALQLEYDGADSTALLERSAKANPLDSASRIRLGLAAEIRGDQASAERWLLEAARVDHQYEPRWTLANYYFRQRQTEPFWTWIRAALEVSYGDRRPAFELCRRMTSDPEEILGRAVPMRAEVLTAFLADALSHREPRLVFPVAMKLARLHDHVNLPLLHAACDFLIDVKETQPAAFLWTYLGYPKPEGVTHPDFETPRVGAGFDWRLEHTAGITHIPLDSPAALRVRLSGEQPESCLLLRQALAVDRTHRYRLLWQARTQNLHQPSGLAWRLGNQSIPVIPSENWSGGSAVVTIPPDPAWLELMYRRPPGETRAEGFIELRQVKLSPE